MNIITTISNILGHPAVATVIVIGVIFAPILRIAYLYFTGKKSKAEFEAKKLAYKYVQWAENEFTNGGMGEAKLDNVIFQIYEKNELVQKFVSEERLREIVDEVVEKVINYGKKITEQ